MNWESGKSGITQFETEDQIGILTIANGMQNKITPADFLDLNQLNRWIAVPGLKGLIITGRGRHFSSGADLEKIKASQGDLDDLKRCLGKAKAILAALEGLPLVTVAAVSGVCFGGGLEIALSCQFRICTANAVFAFPEAGSGIMPGMAGTIRLPRLIGKRKALEILISGRTINAEEAAELGLIDRVVPNKEHVSAAKRFVQELTRNKTATQIRNIIKSINNSRLQPEINAMESETEMFLELVKEL